MRQFTQKVQSSSLGGALVQNVAPLSLSALGSLNATEKLGNLFDGLGGGFSDALRGISLGEFSTGSLANKVGELLGDIDTQNVPTVAGAGSVAMAGVLGLTALFDFDKGSGGSKIVSGAVENQMSSILDIYNEAAKNSTKKKGFLDYVEGGIDWIGDTASDIGEAAWDGLTWTGEKLADAGEAVWDGLTWTGEKLVDAGEAIRDGAKAVANSKPVEYLKEMRGSLIGGGTDIASFCGNVAKHDWGAAAADAYSFTNRFFEFAQDADALLTYGFGTTFESLGIQDKAEEYYGVAEEKSNRAGLADELHATSWGDGLGYAADCIDFGIAGYKMADGIGKLDAAIDGMSWSTWDDFKDNLLSMSGWKDAGTLGEASSMAQKIEYFSDIASNTELVYKYVDGLSEGILGGDGLLSTILKNTSPGKVCSDIVGFAEGFLDLLRSAGEANE